MNTVVRDQSFTCIDRLEDTVELVNFRNCLQ